MAVVNGKSDLITDTHDPSSTRPSPQRARGVVRAAAGTVANGANDSNLSTYHLGSVPSDALVHEDTFFDVENWGFAQIVIGTETDTDALVDQTKVTENMVTPFATGDANHAKAWWEALGLAADPGGQIEIYAHAEANATGAGSMVFRLAWVDID